MDTDELLARRLAAQALTTAQPSAADAVAGLGAVQAQDPASVLTAVALRTTGGTDASVGAALDAGEVLRTHVLRPTWHLVAAGDLRWMVGLTGPRILRGGTGRFRDLGLPPEVRSRARKVLEARLQPGPATRDEVKAWWAAEGLPFEGQAAVHLLMDAEMTLTVCSGPRRGTEATYDLVDRRVPPSPPVPADEADARLAQRYVRGHGPVGERDFVWWSGLPGGRAKRALEAGRPGLRSEPFGDSLVWFVDGPVPGEASHRRFWWLPAYDEYVIAYADRSAFLAPEHRTKTIHANGIFWPVIVDRGRIVGTWRVVRKKPGWAVEADWFSPPDDEGQASRAEWESELNRIRA
jgi:hypothetical protein